MIQTVITLIAIALVAATSLLLVAALGIRKWTPFSVAVYVLCYAQVVLVGEIASLTGVMNSSVAVLGLHTFFLLLSVAVWWWRARPPLLPLPLLHFRFSSWNQISNIFRTQWHVLFLIVLVIVIYAVGAFLIIYVPQNNHDSMVYHLGKVGFWLQYGSMKVWDTPVVMLTATPPNSELAMWWTLLHTGCSNLTGAVQWLSVLAAMPAIYGFARLWGARRSLALCAPLVWACLPENILQSTTTQNDLTVAAPFVSAIYLLCLGMQTRYRRYLLLSGLALGLAIGTKATVFFALPGLAVGCILLLWRYKTKGFVLLLQWAAWCLVGFLILGSYIYIQNFIVYGGFLGPESLSNTHTGSHASFFGKTITHLFLYGIQSLDFTGLPYNWFLTLGQYKWIVAQKIIDALQLPLDQVMLSAPEGLHWLTKPPVYPHEDVAWFGPVSCLVFLPVMIKTFRNGTRNINILFAPVFCSAFGFIFVQAAMMYWSPFRGRYYVLITALCAGLFASGLAWWFSSWWKKLFLLGLLCLTASYTMLCNTAKPLCGNDAIWPRSRTSLQGGISRHWRQRLALVETAVPCDATLGIFISDDWSFPLFGKNMTRHLITVANHEEWANLAEHAPNDNLYLLKNQITGSKPIPNGWVFLSGILNWKVYYCTDKSFDAWPEHVQKQVLDIHMVPTKDPLVCVGKNLAGKVGLGGGIDTASWGMEMWEGERVLWLGRGRDQGMKIKVWSLMPTIASLQFIASPGQDIPKDHSLIINIEQPDGKTSQQNLKIIKGIKTYNTNVSLPLGSCNISIWSGKPSNNNAKGRVMSLLIRHIELNVASADDTPSSVIDSISPSN